jgi:hypothetical protein
MHQPHTMMSNMIGGKGKIYKIPICLSKNYNHCLPKGCTDVIVTINITQGDNYDAILKKVNIGLTKKGYQEVDSFHYLQEDGDYAYVDKEIAEKTDLLYSIKFDTTIYI